MTDISIAHRLHEAYERRQSPFHTRRPWDSLTEAQRQEFITLASDIESTQDQPLDERTTVLCRKFGVSPTDENRAYFARRINEACPPRSA